MSLTRTRHQLGRLHDGYEPIAVILSPPRCGSTVLARSLWEHHVFRGYLHEPYDRAYHLGEEQSPAVMLGSVLERGVTRGDGRGLVIKEMTFQVPERAAELIEVATLPVILLIRDPRLSVSSRMRRREDNGEAAWFPEREAGWRDLAAIREDLLRAGRDYVVVDISDVRRTPEAVLRVICERFGLMPDAKMLSWQPIRGLRLGQLDGRQDDWYRRVLSSTGFERPSEAPPAREYFRTRHMLDVVNACMPVYEQARADPRFIVPSGTGRGRTWTSPVGA